MLVQLQLMDTLDKSCSWFSQLLLMDPPDGSDLEPGDFYSFCFLHLQVLPSPTC